MILIDSNVIIDMLVASSAWKSWSTDKVVEASEQHVLAITPIVVAEVAPRSGSLENFLDALAEFGVGVADLSNEAAFAAGNAFSTYRARRRSGGEAARSIIADFLIGGQAQVAGATILTRDPRFYRAYFPDVPLITPEKDND